MRERLDGFLARAGLGSRSDAKRLIRQKRVRVAGEICNDPGRILRGEEVVFDGRVVEAPPEVLHLVMHKPAGYSCSHDSREAPLVYDLLPRLFALAGPETVGRLDRETTGLLVLTTDGTLVHQLTGPKKRIAKRYRVRYEGRMPEDAPARFAAGFLLDGDEQPTLPADLRIDEVSAAGGRATVVLRQGRYHQVRRMFAQFGALVVDLHRDRMGGLDLPADLAVGAVRPLDEPELTSLCLADPDLG